MEKKITSLLNTELNLKEVHISGDDKHIKIIAIGDIFKGNSQVKRQKMVYKPLINMITEKQIHAVSILSYTLKEWEKYKKNNNFFH